ncbi:MAG: hypothetical protein Kow0029_23630 [Candidatus Rifleibacteriota bacterium]
MKRILASVILTLAIFTSAFPAEKGSRFLNLQLSELSSWQPEAANKKVEQPVISFFNGKKLIKKVRKLPTELKSIEEFVELVLAVNPEIEKQRNLLEASRAIIAQSQALDPLVEQFSSFMTDTPGLVPLFKERPYPGITALKLRIAKSIYEEARLKFEYFLAGMAKNARILAYQICQTRKKIKLVADTAKIYKNLMKTSESFYSNGAISFAEYTMISIDVSKLKTRENQLKIQLKELEEKAVAMLGGNNTVLLSFAKPYSRLFDKSGIISFDSANHPDINAEKTKLSRIADSIRLIGRMAFPEYTYTTSIGPDSGTAIMKMPLKTVSSGMIKFNRVFLQQLSSRYEAQKSMIEELRNKLESDFNSQLEACQLHAKNNAIISGKMLPEMRKAFASVKSRYENGRAGFQELIETERRLLTIEESLIDSNFELAKAGAMLWFSLGKINKTGNTANE